MGVYKIVVETIINDGIMPKLETTTESLKLIKNTKGFNWEIKILSTDINRLVELNNNMKKQFEVTDTVE